MSTFLYIYDIKDVYSLKEKFSDFNFQSMDSIYIECGKDVENIAQLEDVKRVIDITNFFYDTFNGCWRRWVLENLIKFLIEDFKDVIFIIEKKEKKNFFELYPLLFDKEDIEEYLFSNPREEELEEITSIEEKEVKISEVYQYENIEILTSCIDIKAIINFTELMKDFNGVTANFDLDKIKKEEDFFIDLSSLVLFINLRKDQIFLFEIVLNQLRSLNKSKYIIQTELRNDLKRMFPFAFDEFKDLKISGHVEEDIKVENMMLEVNYLEKVQNICDELNNKLIGHQLFKESFKRNLFKFFSLNKINKRKIMSIFLCGKSGVGKTQFASFLSEIMYPNSVQIKLNFGNYSSEGVLNSLIGSPLGYIGSERGGELSNKVKQSESKVILIDEFEKADSKVFNFFYELLEDGKFTDRAGIEHNLNQYIIVFTSNLSEENYKKIIPEPLESRFDMKYNFIPLSQKEKEEFILKISNELVTELFEKEQIIVELSDNIREELVSLASYDNLREIRRKIEDVILNLVLIC